MMHPLYKILATTALSLRVLASIASTTVTIPSGLNPRQLQSSCTTSFTTSTSTYLVYQPEVFSNPPEVGGPAWSTRTTGTGLYATRTGTATLPITFCEQIATQASLTTHQQPSTTASTSAAPITVSTAPITTSLAPATTSAPSTISTAHSIISTGPSTLSTTTTRVSAAPATSSSPASTATSDGTTDPQTVTSTVPPVTVTLKVPERTETETSIQPSLTTSPTPETYSTSEPATGPTSSESATEPDRTPTETPTQIIISTCAVSLAPSATIPPPAPLGPDSDLTWGCPPGTNCDPPKPQLCEAWTDSPADEFTCQAAHCQPVKALILGSGNTNGKFPLNDGYFDLDPTQFGLGFNIFVKPDELTVRDVNYFPLTKALGDDGPRPRDLLSTHLIPASCFETCNNAYLEAQSIGKTPRLCRPQSAFMTYYLACDACVDRNADQTAGALGFITSSSYLSGKFAQFLRFCKGTATTGDVDVGEKKPSAVVISSSSSSAAAGAKTSGASASSSGPATAVVSPDAGGASPHPGAAFAEQKGSAGASPSTEPTAPPPASSSSSQTEAANHGAGQSPELTPSSTIASAPEDRTSSAAPKTATQQQNPQETPPGAAISHAEADVSSTKANNTSLTTGPAGPAAVVTAGSSTWMSDPFGRSGALLFAIIASILIV